MSEVGRNMTKTCVYYCM